jgi:hypothetical protein
MDRVSEYGIREAILNFLGFPGDKLTILTFAACQGRYALVNPDALELEKNH